MTDTAALVQGTTEARALLVDLLNEAAQLEGCLLNAYLYAACSLSSTPQEFAEAGGGQNRRRAIQFERARAWKQSLLDVAQEEMLHLHYVQCLLRALGEPPSFALPARDPQTGSWVIPNWRIRVGAAGPGEGDAVQVPVGPLTPDAIRRFVLYESSNSLQDDDPFGPEMSNLFGRLYEFELDVHFETVLRHVGDDAQRNAMKQRLHTLYTTLPPLAPEEGAAREAPAVAPLPPLEDLRFQSIADFYYKGVLPLYEEAFELGWVVNNNRNLTYELLNPNYAAEGFLPVGPVYRDKNFERFSEANIQNPLRDYKQVGDIIREIVEEGEGATNFEGRAERLLAKVAQLGGARQYLLALLADRRSPDPTPPWLAEGELLRKSHLYRFAMIMAELEQERALAQMSGLGFEPARRPQSVEGNSAMRQLTEELPGQFNACYLVLVAWLSRIYEIREWMADAPRRLAIEMLASWPLMSLAIRPLLELASFFPVDLTRLYRLEGAALPFLPVHAQELQRLFAGPERSEEINVRMDYLAVRVLSDIASWAAGQLDVVAEAGLPDHEREMVEVRLRQLGELNEFQKQFPFRVHGGFSNRLPDISYQRSEPAAPEFEEDPSTLQVPLYQDTLVLRVRFAGWGLVQLATDPDPPLDEAGCSGTIMLHAADGDRRLNRALVWQLSDPSSTILRDPRARLPALGLNGIEASLLVTGAGGASAGYVPLQVMQSTGVQTSGVQQTLQVEGLHELLTFTPDGSLKVELEDKDGRKPFLNGMNHLVWQDGEPIDPFVLSVSTDSELLLRREVFNQGRALLEMEPLQRLLTSRQPCGFDADLSHIPDWALTALSDRQRELLGRGYPMSYLLDRARVLAEALAAELGSGEESREHVDAVASYAARLALVSVPRGTTVGWLRILLHYGHTVSGAAEVGPGDNPVLSALAGRTNLRVGVSEPASRDQPNARWLVNYTKGLMDTDALSDFVFGELHIPLTVQPSDGPIAFAFEWSFPNAMKGAVAEYGCRFATPFWAPYTVTGKTRTSPLPNGGQLIETLKRESKRSYRYTASGIEGVSDFQGAFAVSDGERGADGIKLTWSVSFEAQDPAAVVTALSLIGASAEQMITAMHGHFGPRPGTGAS